MKSLRALTVVIIWAAVALVCVGFIEAQVHVPDLGIDFRQNALYPLRGLERGMDAYDPQSRAYLRAFHAGVASGLYAPAILLTALPWSGFSSATASLCNVIVSMLAIISGVILLIPFTRGPVIRGLVTLLVMTSGATAATLATGQSTALAFLGLAVLLSPLRHRWLERMQPVGLALLLLKPQTAGPLLLALVLLRQGRIAAKAVGLVLAASLPGLLLAVAAAGGPARLTSAVFRNIRFFQDYGPNNLDDSHQGRIDLLALLARVVGTHVPGEGWLVAVALTALLIRSVRHGGWERGLRDPPTGVIVLSYCLLVAYHQNYDLLLFAPVVLVGILDPRIHAPAWFRLLAFVYALEEFSFGPLGQLLHWPVSERPKPLQASVGTVMMLAFGLGILGTRLRRAPRGTSVGLDRAGSETA